MSRRGARSGATRDEETSSSKNTASVRPERSEETTGEGGTTERPECVV